MPTISALSSQSIKSVCLVCHGLNLNPEKMKCLSSFLNSESVETYTVSLSGHKPGSAHMSQVSSTLWISELYRAYKKAREKAKTLGVPLYYLGFSLGGALNSALMHEKKDVTYDKIILFAPAISVRRTSYLIRIFKPFGKGFSIPSFSPKSYRANFGITVAAYDALFEAISISKENQYEALNVPTLIFIDPFDELVSPNGLMKIKENHGLEHWNFNFITKTKGSTKSKFRHFIINEETLGDKTWGHVKDKMKAFIEIP